MKVTTKPMTERTVTLEATMDELVVLYDATRKGRRTKAQEQALLDFGDALSAAVSIVPADDDHALDQGEGAEG